MKREEVKAALDRYTAYRTVTDSTLMGYNKKELVSFIRVLEHNWAAAEESLHQQTENMKDWEPKRRGHWEHIVEQKSVWDKHLGEHIVETPKTRCSLCKETDKNYEPPYCPHCGALMDEVTENAET